MLDILTSCVLIRIVSNPINDTKLIPKQSSFQEVLWIVLAVVGLYSSKQMDSQILPDFHRISLHPIVTILVEDSCLNLPDQLVKSFWAMFPEYLAKMIFIKTPYNFATKKYVDVCNPKNPPMEVFTVELVQSLELPNLNFETLSGFETLDLKYPPKENASQSEKKYLEYDYLRIYIYIHINIQGPMYWCDSYERSGCSRIASGCKFGTDIYHCW